MRTDPLVLAALLALAAPGAAAAQAQPDTVAIYEREVFRYQRAGRPDPFRSLLGSADLGVRAEDLALVGVVYNEDPARSVAVITQAGAERRVRARVGERIGGVRVVAIRPTSVDLVIEEFGIARRETLALKPAAKKGSSS